MENSGWRIEDCGTAVKELVTRSRDERENEMKAMGIAAALG
jgi:hypothetical protein